MLALAKMLISPPSPAGTKAELVTIRPWDEFRVETNGRGLRLTFAEGVFAKARLGYHPITTSSVAALHCWRARK